MKVDLSKYSPGTRFKLKNGLEVTLIGRSFTASNHYILEYDHGLITLRFQDGTYPEEPDVTIESVV